MPTVEFAPALTRHVACPPQRVEALTLRMALEAAFAAAPALRGYVLDEQGAVRKHVAVFVNSQLIASRSNLELPLAPLDQVMLALGSTTGGLWISEDAGAAWRCVSRDLPPIAVLRWV